MARMDSWFLIPAKISEVDSPWTDLAHVSISKPTNVAKYGVFSILEIHIYCWTRVRWGSPLTSSSSVESQLGF